MQDVAKHIGLVKRSNGYSLRIVVPKDVRAAFAPIWDRERSTKATRRKGAELPQVWVSLGPVSHREAIARANLERVRLDGLFDEARASLARPPGAKAPLPASPTRDAIHRAVRAYLYNLEKNAKPVPFDPQEREEALAHAIEEASGMHGTPFEDGYVQRVAKSVADAANISLIPGDSLWREMIAAVKAAMDEHASRDVARLSPGTPQVQHPLFAGISPTQPPARVLTLREAVDAYKAAPERSGRAPRTKAAYTFRLAVWCDLLGPDADVSTITRPQVNAARDTLLAVPANAAKKWPGKPLADVAAMAKAQTTPSMGSKSVKLYVEAFASLMKWLLTEQKITANPASGIGVPDKPADEEAARRPMTIAELNRLFRSGPYATPSASRGWRFWLPLVALFEGMRLGEILGLRADDIRQQDGVQVIDIRGRAGRSLKTPQSARLVPVHPILQELGFMAFAARQPSGDPLFTDLPGGADNPLNAAQKALGRFIRGTFPNDRDVVFHSLRHTWTDAGRNAYIPDEILQRLGGWKAPGRSAMGGYGNGFRPSVLAAEVAKMKYDGLDLTRLRQLQ